MKEQVQDTGIRRWYGDDFLTIQNEAMAIWEGLFGQFGDFIVSGLGITDNGDGTYNIAPGIVMLDGKICRFYGANNVNLPIYLVQATQTTNREYLYGGIKPVMVEYVANWQNTQPIGINYLTINQSGNRTWRDAIQDSAYRMVSDALINAWNSHINNTNNPHQITPEQIGAANNGLTNVPDNTLLSKIKNVDGAGSGLDADLLQGIAPTAFATADHNHDDVYYKIYLTYYTFSSNVWKNIIKMPSGYIQGYYKFRIIDYGGNLNPLGNLVTQEVVLIIDWLTDAYIYHSFYDKKIIKAIRVRDDGAYYHIDFISDYNIDGIRVFFFLPVYSRAPILGLEDIDNPSGTVISSVNIPDGVVIATHKIATIDESSQPGTIYADDFIIK